MTSTSFLRAALGLALLGSSLAAQADVVRGAVSASANVSGFPGSPSAWIDQSGLTAPYTSGVTDWDSYVASTKHSYQSQSPINFWGNSYGQSLPVVDLDLGAVYDIDGLAVWNLADAQGSTTSFRLETDTDGLLTTTGDRSLIGTFNLSVPPYGAVAAQTFSFATVSAQHLVISLLTASNNTLGMAFLNEVAFSQVMSPVPEPASAALVLAGLGVVGSVARRRRS